jgi:hypothetical protein
MNSKEGKECYLLPQTFLDNEKEAGHKIIVLPYNRSMLCVYCTVTIVEFS